jgi:hypothetical protein
MSQTQLHQYGSILGILCEYRSYYNICTHCHCTVGLGLNMNIISEAYFLL